MAQQSIYKDELFTYNGKQRFMADYYQNTKREGQPALSRQETKVDYQWGDGQEIADSLITRQMSAAWKTVFTPEQTGEVCFELKAGGQAIADVLFGDYNPAGRLPVTFYKSVNDLPDFEDYSMANRTYRYFAGTPVYPFGYGLSYTTFGYSNLETEKTADASSLKVKAVISNTGEKEGDEVVQLYLSNKQDFTTPIRALKGFKRIHLAPGESKEVEFILSAEDLSVVNEAGNPAPMKGDVTISVGGGQPSASLLSAHQCVQQQISLP
jgi:beta-glucosidase